MGDAIVVRRGVWIVLLQGYLYRGGGCVCMCYQGGQGMQIGGIGRMYGFRRTWFVCLSVGMSDGGIMGFTESRMVLRTSREGFVLCRGLTLLLGLCRGEMVVCCRVG